ncbi:MAG: hypothetical protein NTW21_40925, partial [Verrucomicrobia bacterium]|nr:hypothetical protein [Verrucomicrobiota bacterium]
EGASMNRSFGTHSWAALPLPPQECGGSYRARVTPGATPAHRVLMLRTGTPNPGDDPDDGPAAASAGT